jgi:hypothetical protein
MTLLVALTGGIGFVFSALLLKVGVETIWLRYALAVIAAYAAFLGLLWLWLRTRARDYVDAPGVPDGPVSSGKNASELDVVGDGGEFGGGGASGTFETSSAEAVDVPDAIGDAIGSADEAAIPVAALLIALAIALSSLWLVYLAPTLLAELVLDVALAAGLYRRLRHVDARHWLETAVRRTVLPFTLTMFAVIALGAWIEHAYPGARSIGDVLAR